MTKPDQDLVDLFAAAPEVEADSSFTDDVVLKVSAFQRHKRLTKIFIAVLALVLMVVFRQDIHTLVGLINQTMTVPIFAGLDLGAFSMLNSLSVVFLIIASGFWKLRSLLRH